MATSGSVPTVELAAGIGYAFTDRHGGVSDAPYATMNLGGGVADDPAAVTENRARSARRLGVDPAQVVWLNQVHGAAVAHAASPRSGDAPRADAVWTEEAGLALAVLVADCVPVLVADPGARLVGAAHSGRPGTEAGVVPALLRAMRAAGADPARMVAMIGPAVCGACYEVPATLRERVAAAVPATFTTTAGGTPGLDLPAGVAAQLAAAGVVHIRRDPRCTMECTDLYSYRRDGTTGRFAGYVWLRP